MSHVYIHIHVIHETICVYTCICVTYTLIERNLPPRGGFLFTMFPDQEPCVRDFTTRCDGRILSSNLLHTALDQGTTQQRNLPGGGGFLRSMCIYMYMCHIYVYIHIWSHKLNVYVSHIHIITCICFTHTHIKCICLTHTHMVS